MANSFSSPSSRLPQNGIVPLASVFQVRWIRPTFATFRYVSLLWGFCTGIPVGIAGFVGSLFGAETRATALFWEFQGITAGVVGILLFPAIFTLFGAGTTILFPLFRLGAPKGLRLSFQAESDRSLYLSRLQLRSYIKLSAIFGFLLALFFDILLILFAVIGGISKVDDIVAVAAVPLLFQGAAKLTWIVLATPLLYSIYSAVLGVLAFIPFHLFTRMLTGAALPSHEVLRRG